MTRTALALLAACALTLPGCIVIGGSSKSNYRGYGAVESATMDQIVAANAQNRIGEDQAAVLARYPADNVSLLRSEATAGGGERSVYRVYARERDRATRFERFLVFEDGRLILLTDERDEIGPPVD